MAYNGALVHQSLILSRNPVERWLHGLTQLYTLMTVSFYTSSIEHY